LYNPNTDVALIIISEEAETLIPIIRQAPSSSARVHLLTYSAPVTRKMLPFSSLTYYSIPALPKDHIVPYQLTIEVGLFAGRLYMDYAECTAFAEYIKNTTFSKRLEASVNEKINFMLEWFTLRRKGQDIMHTPVGYIFEGRPLNEDHPFFVTQGATSKDLIEAYRSSAAAEEVSNDNEDDEMDDVWHDVEETMSDEDCSMQEDTPDEDYSMTENTSDEGSMEENTSDDGSMEED
jgi:hypothetical protein